MNNTENPEDLEKVPHWIWKVPIIIMAIGVALIVWNIFSKYIPSISTTSISSAISSSLSFLSSENTKNQKAGNIGEVYDFPDGVNQKEFVLQPNEWSEWIATPSASTYRISTGNKPIKICFVDGKCTPYEKQETKYLGIKRGIFRIFSNEEIKVIVTIERL